MTLFPFTRWPPLGIQIRKKRAYLYLALQSKDLREPTASKAMFDNHFISIFSIHFSLKQAFRYPPYLHHQQIITELRKVIGQSGPSTADVRCSSLARAKNTPPGGPPTPSNHACNGHLLQKPNTLESIVFRLSDRVPSNMTPRFGEYTSAQRHRIAGRRAAIAVTPQLIKRLWRHDAWNIAHISHDALPFQA